MRALLAAVFLSGLVTTACDELYGTHSCTEVGCGDSAAVEVQRRGPWADGEYALDVTVDGRQHRCRFELRPPRGDELPRPGVACTPSLSSEAFGEGVTLVADGAPLPDAACVSGADGGAAPPCEGLRYRISIHLDPSAVQVSVRLAFGEALLLDQTRRLEYVKEQPNGPDCSPTCRSAQLLLEIPDP